MSTKMREKQRDWDSFKKMISTMVKDLPASMPKAYKLDRLLTCLDRKAAARLAGVPRTIANSDAAWNILMTHILNHL